MPHEVFHYRSIEEIRETAAQNGVFLPFVKNSEAVLRPVQLAGRGLGNRVCLQPMEGTDGGPLGAPGALTFRRYERFARGGAALIWFEAVAVDPRVRASAGQLCVTRDNLGEYKRIVDEMKEAGLKENGYAPMIVMQATHSGRYSKPHGYPEPLIAYPCPPLEDTPLDAACVVSDDDLRRYEQMFEETARLAAQAGFDGMDIKCCHRYLACELLSAFTRPGKYGGSFENRTRFLKNAYRAAKAGSGGGFFLTSRMNAYDGFAYPYGFGIAEEGFSPDLREPIRLIGELRAEFGIPMINVTMGNPYRNPHVSRPYDRGVYIPDEHPLVSLARMMDGVGVIQKALPDVPVIGTAFSYPRQFSPNLAAGMIEGGSCAMAGFGRMAFAYPDFVKDLKNHGAIDPAKVCVACGGCALLLRAGTPAGCVARDREVYAP